MRNLGLIGAMLLVLVAAIVLMGLRTEKRPEVVFDEWVIFETRDGDGNPSAVYRVTNDGAARAEHPLNDVLQYGRNAAVAPGRGVVFFDSMHAEVFTGRDVEWETPRIVTARMDGTGEPTVLDEGARPHVSPDEGRLVFIAGDRRIVVRDLDSGETTDTGYLAGRYTNVVWVSDSELVFQRKDADDDISLVRVDVDAGAVTDLGDGWIIPQSVSPDGRYVTCWRWRQNGIFLIDTETNSIEMVYRQRFLGSGVDYVWASNGAGFFFHRESFMGAFGDGPNRHLYYCDLEQFEVLVSRGFRFESGISLGAAE